MATLPISFDSDQSFVTSLPLYTSPFLEQPFSPCDFEQQQQQPRLATSSSSISSSLQDHAEVKGLQRICLQRSTANIVSLKDPPQPSPRLIQSFWQFFTETSSNKARDDHSTIEDDSFSSDGSYTGSSSAFSTPSPSPLRKGTTLRLPGLNQDIVTSTPSRYVRPRILIFKRSLSTIKQSSSTKSSDFSEPSPPRQLASPFKPVPSRRHQPRQSAEIDWICELDVSRNAKIATTSCPSICLSPTRSIDREAGRRRISLLHIKSEGDLRCRRTSTCTQGSSKTDKPLLCGMSLSFARRTTRSRGVSPSPTTPPPSSTSSPRLIASSPSTEMSPNGVTLHQSPSVSFAELVEITSALLAAPLPPTTSS